MMKTIRRGFVLLLILLTAGFLFVSVRERRQTVSVYENRTLAASPEFSLQSAWDGSYWKGWDAYFSDHAARRDQLLRDWAWLQLCVKRQPVVNDVVVTPTVLLPYLGDRDLSHTDFEAVGRDAVERLLPIQAAVEARGGLFLYLEVEGYPSVYRDEFPAMLRPTVDYYRQRAAAFDAAAAEKGLKLLRLQDVLEPKGGCKPYYYKVDHHYTLYGAHEAYLALCARCREEGLELPVLEEPGIYSVDAEFLGAYSRKLYELSPVKGEFYSFDLSLVPPYTRWDEGVQTDAPLIAWRPGEPTVRYEAYMGGDRGETVICTERPELPSILIVGDSYTNPVEAFCVCSFNEVRSLDFRYYSGKTLSQYLRDYPADVVVILRDSVNSTIPEGNGDLR